MYARQGYFLLYVLPLLQAAYPDATARFELSLSHTSLCQRVLPAGSAGVDLSGRLTVVVQHGGFVES